MVGEGICCQYQIEAGNTLRPLPITALSKREHQQYSCHAWALDNDASGLLVVGSRRGELLVVQEGEARQVLQLDDGAAVESLAAFAKVRGGGRRHWLGQLLRASLPSRHERIATRHGSLGHSQAGEDCHHCLPLCACRALWWAPAAARW